MAVISPFVEGACKFDRGAPIKGISAMETQMRAEQKARDDPNLPSSREKPQSIAPRAKNSR
jgi:hypothetical protein